MRISFDLDDTLITRRHPWPTESATPSFRDRGLRLRAGTVELFRWLRERHHEIWIYTNSYRGWRELQKWFTACGIPVDGVINQVEHDRARMARAPDFAGEKNPAWFEIDLHIDDRESIARPTPASDFDVLRIDPRDRDWVRKIIQAVQDMGG